MKRKFVFFLTFTLLIAFCAAYAAVANPGFKIFVNGAEIIYTANEPQPRIISNRAMLPVVTTMQKVGVALDWNSETGTLVMTKDGNVATHIMYSNVLTINGVPKTYDTSSLLQNGEALIPAIMLADVLGCDSTWDASARHVIMRTKSGMGSGTIPGALPEIISFTMNTDSLRPGDELIINVIADENATTIDLVNASGLVVASSSRFTKAGDSNSFIIRYNAPSVTTSLQRFILRAGNAEGMNNASSKNVTFYVQQSSDTSTTTTTATSSSDTSRVTLNIRNITFPNKTYSVGDTVTATVTTSQSAIKLEVYDRTTRSTAEYTSYTDSGTSRTFKVNVSPSAHGANTYNVTAYNAAGSTNSRSFTVNTRLAYTTPTYTFPSSSYYYGSDWWYTYWNYPYYWDYYYYFYPDDWYYYWNLYNPGYWNNSGYWNWNYTNGTHIYSYSGLYDSGSSYGFDVGVSSLVTSIYAKDTAGYTYSGYYSGGNTYSFTIPKSVGGVTLYALSGGTILEQVWVSPYGFSYSNNWYYGNPYGYYPVSYAYDKIKNNNYSTPLDLKLPLDTEKVRLAVINHIASVLDYPANASTFIECTNPGSIDITAVTSTPLDANVNITIRDIWGRYNYLTVPIKYTVS